MATLHLQLGHASIPLVAQIKSVVVTSHKSLRDNKKHFFHEHFSLLLRILRACLSQRDRQPR